MIEQREQMYAGRRERIEGYGKDAVIHHRIKVEGKLRTRAQAAGAVRSGASGLECVLGGEFETADADGESREYPAARKLPKGEPKSDAWEARRAAFGAVRQRFQFSEYGLHDDAKQFGHSWLGDHLDSHGIQKIATGRLKRCCGLGLVEPVVRASKAKTRLTW